MISLAFVFFDFVSLALYQKWLVQLLVVYFFTQLIIYEERMPWGVFLGNLILIVLQDYSMYGKFGFCLIYLFPILLCFLYLKKIFHHAPFSFLSLLTTVYLLAQAVLINKLIFKQEILLTVTIFKIIVNLVAGIVILFGLRGDRSFLYEKERKVWTPNRIDAS